MNSYNRYRGRRRPRRNSLMLRRLIFLAAAVAILVGLIVLIVRLASGKKTPDPAAPSIQPIATEAPAAEPSAEPAAAETTIEPAAAEPVVTAEIAAEPAMAAETAAPTEEPSAGDSDQTEPGDGDIPAFAAQVTIAPVANASPATMDTGRSLHVRVVGDIMFHKYQLTAAQQIDGSYDFDLQFYFIKPSLAAADFTMANLETTVGKYKDTAYSGYPQFNSPESVLQSMKDCGIDFFTMANNHMLDRWFDGLKQDVNLVEQYGFGHVGAYRTKEERNTPVVMEVGGIKLGFVAYTHTTNTMEQSSDKAVFEYAVPYLYKADIEGDVQALRDAGAEVIIAFPHWGEENTYIPDSTQKKYAARLAKAGVDIILGNHSHMVQPMQVVYGTGDDGRQRQVFCIYSIGNFLSSQMQKRADNGIILDFTIQEQADGTFQVENIGYVPVYVWKESGQCTVLPILKYRDNRPSTMSDVQYQRMLESYDEIVCVLGTGDGTATFRILTE